jgi:hypothetical protein
MFPYTKPYWLTPGIEPCSSASQTDALPNKLKSTFVIENRLELLSPISEAGMLLPIAIGTPLNNLRFVRELNP